MIRAIEKKVTAGIVLFLVILIIIGVNSYWDLTRRAPVEVKIRSLIPWSKANIFIEMY